ncbi:pentapeptide repeat-containing protein [Aquicoccus porphyridii]|uniref:Pentapeptide repeat-containing protein n=1 Tax=Aquicoccus porphyridii TaxID=1852029 RepID=A0A5A9YY94_9RHOB|nr:pentapeptide repeat-containing protein [Aquicoccus porphyridii]KAA0909842.1 pentapeptide repeat-containing protein [Aquicoccus porphyridii]RAI53245.1 hypothetical protein DOO74_13020 [Rhodobacteraceae bacterium AsT-22]
MDDKQPKDLLDWMALSKAPDWRVARPLGPLVALFLALLIAGAYAAAFFLIYGVLFGRGEASLGTGALIAALLGAPFVIWGTVLKHQTVRYQKEGHITDRINKAVEQLGAEKTVKKDGDETTKPNIEVRIGAILSLERIAQDSTSHDNGRDHVRVMEILCAYIRENSNARKPVDFPLIDWEPLKADATEEERTAHLEWRKARFGNIVDSNAREWAQSLPKPRTDVQLALTVIGRRNAQQRRVEAAWPDPPTETTVWPFDSDFARLPDDPGADALSKAELDAFMASLREWKATLDAYRGYRLDLSGANLQRADMAAKQPDGSDAVFAGAQLTEARMEGVVLVGARMVGATLGGTRMEGINFVGTRMEGATLGEARMEGAALGGARMEGAALGGARMEGADLWGVRMEGGVLFEARMEGGLLFEARMEGAGLSKARMEGAGLFGARMEGADFSEARMDSHTGLHDAKLQGAALRNVDYSSVGITQEQVDATFGDASVTLPKRITRPVHWPDWELPNRPIHRIGWELPPFDETTFYTQWRKWLSNPATYTPPPKPTSN